MAGFHSIWLTCLNISVICLRCIDTQSGKQLRIVIILHCFLMGVNSERKEFFLLGANSFKSRLQYGRPSSYSLLYDRY